LLGQPNLDTLQLDSACHSTHAFVSNVSAMECADRRTGRISKSIVAHQRYDPLFLLSHHGWGGDFLRRYFRYQFALADSPKALPTEIDSLDSYGLIVGSIYRQCRRLDAGGICAPTMADLQPHAHGRWNLGTSVRREHRVHLDRLCRDVHASFCAFPFPDGADHLKRPLASTAGGESLIENVWFCMMGFLLAL